MRHRRKGRVLGRDPAHQRALLKNLASALILTERDTEDLRYLKLESEPAVKGRIVTTISKAKEVRPLVEKCITVAKRALPSIREAATFASDAERGTDAYKKWRSSDQWVKWNQAMAPALSARRRCIQLLGDKLAVQVLFDTLAERFEDRPGGYTRIVRLAMPRLGDAGTRAILEFVGVRDRIVEKSEKPAFDGPDNDGPEDDSSSDEPSTETKETAAAE